MEIFRESRKRPNRIWRIYFPVNFKCYKNVCLSKLATFFSDHKSNEWAGYGEPREKMEAPFDVEKITADDINMEGMEDMESVEDIINTSLVINTTSIQSNN